MPALDPALPGALIMIVAVVLALVAVWLIDRLRGGKGKAGTTLHGMGKEESLSYFRDYGAGSRAPGVREEDRAERWGEGDGSPPR